MADASAGRTENLSSKRRRCAHKGCITLLSERNGSEYCYTHQTERDRIALGFSRDGQRRTVVDLICPYPTCGDVFPTERGLKTHKASIHGDYVSDEAGRRRWSKPA